MPDSKIFRISLYSPTSYHTSPPPPQGKLGEYVPSQIPQPQFYNMRNTISSSHILNVLLHRPQGYDTFCPIGPFIPKAAVPDPQAQRSPGSRSHPVEEITSFGIFPLLHFLSYHSHSKFQIIIGIGKINRPSPTIFLGIILNPHCVASPPPQAQVIYHFLGTLLNPVTHCSSPPPPAPVTFADHH